MTELTIHRINKLLIALGSGAIGINVVANLDLILGLCLKVTGLISFFMFLVMNWDRYIEKWRKLKVKYSKK